MKQKMTEFYKRNPDISNLALITIVALLIGLVVGILYFNSPSKKAEKENLINAQIQNSAPQNSTFDTGVFGDVKAYTSDGGENIIGEDYTPVPMKLTDNPDNIWEEEQYAGRFTPVESATLKDGSLGVLNIKRIGISTNIYESNNDMETLGKNVAHFPSTSAWDGNIGLSAHNINLDGTSGLFLNLHQLQQGDVITYKTALGERTYTVTTVKTIAQNDWSYLGHRDENVITLITCITGQPNNRLVVQAVETNS